MMYPPSRPTWNSLTSPPLRPDPERVGQLVPEHVDHQRTRQPEKRDQPQQPAQREKVKLLRRPEMVPQAREGELLEERLARHPAHRQQQYARDRLEPARRHGSRARRPAAAAKRAGSARACPDALNASARGMFLPSSSRRAGTFGRSPHHALAPAAWARHASCRGERSPLRHDAVSGAAIAHRPAEMGGVRRASCRMPPPPS